MKVRGESGDTGETTIFGKKKFWERTDGEEAAKEERRGKRVFC